MPDYRHPLREATREEKEALVKVLLGAPVEIHESEGTDACDILAVLSDYNPMCHCDGSDKLADAILAAGYRRAALSRGDDAHE